MVFDFVCDMLGGSVPDPLVFVAYLVSGILLFVFSAVILNFFFNMLNQFFFKS